MNKMQKWIGKHGTRAAFDLAERAGTSLAVLRQIAGAYRTGGVPSTTPEVARAIEKATEKVTPGDVVQREHLCRACGACELAKAARKK